MSKSETDWWQRTDAVPVAYPNLGEKKMIDWHKAQYPKPSYNDGKKIFANPEWDRIFRQIKPQDIRPEFRPIFFSIKEQYDSRGNLTEKQADWLRTCWKFQQGRRSQGRGVSRRTFRGLPRCVGETIYWNSELATY